MKMMRQHWCAGALVLIGVLSVALPQTAGAHGETLLRIAAVTRRIQAATNNAALLYLERGELYREHQDWTAAEADYARAAELDPGLATVDLCRARLLADSGKLEAAHTLFNKVIERSSREAEAFVGRARVLLKLNQRKAAIADLNRVLELSTEPKTEDVLELAQALVAEGRAEEALLRLDEGMKKLGPMLALQGYAMDLELRRKNTNAALARLDTMIEQTARKEMWLARRGEILLEANRGAEARQAFKAALRSIDILPPRLQQSPSVLDLQNRVRSALAKIDAQG